MEKDIMKNKLCIGFKGYEVQKINLHKKQVTDETQGEVGFLFKIIPNRERDFDKINVLQGVLIEPSEEFEYSLEVVIKGKFILNNCKDDEEKYKYITTNASAILFPYLRALVSVVTSQTDYENIVLPVMNFYKIFEDYEIEDLLLDKNQFEDFE